ncbi:MAG: hypothetical protein IJI36_10745, partial [Kiritimatiellae bacterium]|nr:hypothetical protein [Kiritimatiellia bacterium]
MRLTRKAFIGGTAAFGALAARELYAKRSYLDTTSWDPFVPNIADEATYLRRKFRQDVTDKATGLDIAGLKNLLREILASGKAAGESWRITKAKCFAALCTRQAIDVSHFDWFPAIACWDRHNLPMNIVLGARAKEIREKYLPKEMELSRRSSGLGAWGCGLDYCHSVPEWHAILPIGFPGMKARVEKYAKPGDPYYDGLLIAADGMLAGIDRFIAQGKKNLGRDASRVSRLTPYETARLEKEIACLERLRKGPPQTAYDVLMFLWLIFFYGDHLDAMQVRSLSQIDVTLTPYYEADVAAGRTTEAEFREQFKHFLWQWGSICFYWNQPIGLGGTRKDGTSEFNHVSKIILDVADECALPTPKFLVKIAPNTPEWAMDKMLDMVRRHRSICFCGEQSMTRIMKSQGYTDEQCRTMILKGCYEFADRCNTNETLPGRYSLLRPVPAILHDVWRGALDPARLPTFEAFRAEYERRLVASVDAARKTAFAYEKHLGDVNPSNVFTLSSEYAIAHGKDAFADGCEKGNNTAYFMTGLGTAVDALLAVKEYVYERKELSLKEFGTILHENWEGHEPLRQRILRGKRKWGNNDAEANALGGRIAHVAGSRLNGIPNSRGGVFLNSGHSARAFIWAGRHIGASPDGRKRGEEVSKNLSPTMGADTEGVTALVATLAHV